MDKPKRHKLQKPRNIRKHVRPELARARSAAGFSTAGGEDGVPGCGPRNGWSKAYQQACKIRSTRRWQKLRKMILRRSPLCLVCGIRAATEVHHLEAVAKRPDLAYTPSNLAPTCGVCHPKIEAAERRGVSMREILPADYEVELG